ncbi:MAG TPA: hypothetical protein PKA82_17635 [Pyrinomonadaceae bacterium]|nr:hypothetical protein [Pyrinomonadaceae bacterium]
MVTGSTTTKEKFQAEFEALPLEEKFSTLFKLEAAALKETLNVFVDSSKDFFEKAGEAMKDMGPKFEQNVTAAYESVKKEACPTEAETPKAETKSKAKSKKKASEAE